MPALNEHPTVKKIKARIDGLERPSQPLDAAWLRALVLSAATDDVGFVNIERSEVDDQREELLQLFPPVRTIIPYVVRMHREPIRAPFRSVANHEFHITGDEVDVLGRRVVSLLKEHGIRALNPPMAFPMEANRFPDRKTWVISYRGRRMAMPGFASLTAKRQESSHF